jgi:hypothetical protein
MIKKILTGAVFVGAVTTIGLVSADQYQNYQTNHQPEPTVTASQSRAAVEHAQGLDRLTYQALQDQYDKLKTECLKGAVAYDALPVANKAKAPRPTCEQTAAR